MGDINPMRDLTIRACGLFNADRPYTLYYDETNNPRRLHVTAEGFNVKEPMCFVLGGVGHRGPPRPLSLDELRAAARIQPNVKELKLEHLGKGDFLQVLNSTRVETFLAWLLEQYLFIHYLAVDPLYWSSVDIIDSVLAHESMQHMQVYQAILKDDLHTILRSDRAAIAEFYFRYDYPAVAPDRRADFLEELRDWIDYRNDLLEHFHHQMLKDVLKAGRKVDNLPFIEGEKPKTLIDDFAGFFISRISLFKYATHLLDVEEQIRPRLEAADLRDGETQLANWRFIDSKAEPGVQISDVVVGLIGKFLSYVTDSEPEDLDSVLAGLTDRQRANVRALNVLLDRACEETPALMHTVLSASDQQKALAFVESA